MAVLGLRFCARAFSSCGKRGPLFIAVRGPLTVTASLVAEHRLQTHRLSNRGSWAQLLRGMWDLPRPGLEPASPALAGRFSTTAPPGKPSPHFLTDLRQEVVLLCPSWKISFIQNRRNCMEEILSYLQELEGIHGYLSHSLSCPDSGCSATSNVSVQT